MRRLSYIAVLAMLEADQPTQEQWEVLLSMLRGAGQSEGTTRLTAEEISVQVLPVPRTIKESRDSGPELMTRAEAAEYLGTSAATLATWACTRSVEVPFVKVGRLVRYRRRDLDTWLDSQVVRGD